MPMRFSSKWPGLFASALALAGIVHAAPLPPVDSDAALLAARDAFRAGDRTRLDVLVSRLRGHVLEPYAGYWALQLRIEEADATTVRAFVEEHADAPVAERARIAWMKVLGKRQEWTTFREELPALGTVDDPELRCFVIQSKRAGSGDEALREAVPLWFTGRETPESCSVLFDALLARGELTPADVWTRFRLAGETGRFRLGEQLIERLPEGERISRKLLDQAAAAPSKVLARNDLRLESRSHRELVLHALQRAARESPAATREPWTRVRDRLPAADRAYGNAQLAYHAARRLMPDALAWYREAGSASLSDELLAWKARAALRSAAWKDVAAAIDDMTPAARQDSAWRYWRARARREQGEAAEAQAALSELSSELGFYGLLAGEDLGKSLSLASQPLAADEQALQAFGARSSVRRMLKLYELDMRPEALQEWIFTLRGASDAELLSAAEFARRNQVYDRAINAAERTRERHDFALRFLAPHRELLAAAARQFGLEEALVLGLVRQESRFVEGIVSSAGAVGLMQLMPSTAKWVAKALGRGDYHRGQIGRAEINAEFGSFYLRHVLDRLDGLPVLATAAYNAGPGRAQAWRATNALEGAVYVESIPFSETRDYVKKVLANAVLYSHQLGLPKVPLKQRLGTIPPRGEPAPESAALAQ